MAVQKGTQIIAQLWSKEYHQRRSSRQLYSGARTPFNGPSLQNNGRWIFIVVSEANLHHLISARRTGKVKKHSKIEWSIKPTRCPVQVLFIPQISLGNSGAEEHLRQYVRGVS